MKKLVYLLCVAFLSAACVEKGKYTISGTAADADLEGKYVYLIKYYPDGGIEKADTALITNGTFSFEGTQPTPEVYSLMVDLGEEQQQQFLQLEGGNMTAEVANDIIIKGTPANDAYALLNEKLIPVLQEMEKAEKDDEYMVLYDKQKALYAEYFHENINQPLGMYIYGNTPWGRRLNQEQLQNVVDVAGESFKTTPLYDKATTRLNAMKNSVVGNKFTDIVSKDTLGNEMKLSDYVGKGKYVLLDFWASWCPPCRKEMPNLVSLYEQYKDKNFEIVSYSLDKHEEAWKKGIIDLKMNWPQMSDCQYWESQGSMLYAVPSIPHTILIDPEGTIIDRALLGEALSDKLKEILK